MSSDNYPHSRRTRDSIVARNKLALYEDQIFDSPYATEVIVADYAYAIDNHADFISPEIALDAEAEGVDDWFPDRLRTRIEYEPTNSISIDALAADIIAEYDPEDVTLKTPASWVDEDIDVEAIERKIIGTGPDSNPLEGIDRDTLNKMPWLPYIAAIREYVKYPANGEPEFIGMGADIITASGIIHRLPSEGEAYASPVGEMVKELVRKAGLVRQAKIIERVTAQARSHEEAFAVKAGEDVRASFEDVDETEDETFTDNDGPFGMDEPLVGARDRAALSASIRRHIPLVAADVTNTRVAKHFHDQKIGTKQATVLLQQRQFDPGRIAKVLQLMAAYQKTSK